MSGVEQQPVVAAVLGPTNTGKTHYAIERMLGHANGMIGFPLRLLARENYDRVVAKKARHEWRLLPAKKRLFRLVRSILSVQWNRCRSIAT